MLWGYEMITGYGQTIKIPRADIIHHKYTNPRDRFWGWSTLAAASEAKLAADSIKRAQLKAFDQDILSSLYFSTDAMLDEPGWKRMMANLIERHSGVQKAGMPVLLYGGVKPIASQRAWSEMAFKDSAAFTRDEILASLACRRCWRASWKMRTTRTPPAKSGCSQWKPSSHGWCKSKRRSTRNW